MEFIPHRGREYPISSSLLWHLRVMSEDIKEST